MKLSLFFFFIAFGCRRESLHYTINWPSGLSLGEATLGVQADGSGLVDPSSGVGPPITWTTSMDIDASVPGFAVRDHYKSTA